MVTDSNLGLLYSVHMCPFFFRRPVSLVLRSLIQHCSHPWKPLLLTLSLLKSLGFLSTTPDIFLVHSFVKREFGMIVRTQHP